MGGSASASARARDGGGARGDARIRAETGRGWRNRSHQALVRGRTLATEAERAATLRAETRATGAATRRADTVTAAILGESERVLFRVARGRGEGAHSRSEASSPQPPSPTRTRGEGIRKTLTACHHRIFQRLRSLCEKESTSANPHFTVRPIPSIASCRHISAPVSHPSSVPERHTRVSLLFTHRSGAERSTGAVHLRRAAPLAWPSRLFLRHPPRAFVRSRSSASNHRVLQKKPEPQTLSFASSLSPPAAAVDTFRLSSRLLHSALLSTSRGRRR